MATASQTGYTLRAATAADAAGIATLLREYDAAECPEDVTAWTAEDLFGDWEALDVATDTWLALAPDGALAGYAALTKRGDGECAADGYVHPHHVGRGVGSLLVSAVEQRAGEIAAGMPAEQHLKLANNVVATSKKSCELLEARGYALARIFWRMRIEMTVPPPLVELPDGITLRVCQDEADLHRAYAVSEAAFADHWGHQPISYADWLREQQRDGQDTSRWFLAQAGNEVVGIALCLQTPEGRGWVRRLAVVRAWRKRGLGNALLHHAFGAFWQSGIASVGLGVDSANLTGAQRLYERAGMRVVSAIARYEKDIRPPSDLGGFHPYV